MRQHYARVNVPPWQAGAREPLAGGSACSVPRALWGAVRVRCAPRGPWTCRGFPPRAVAVCCHTRSAVTMLIGSGRYEAVSVSDVRRPGCEALTW